MAVVTHVIVESLRDAVGRTSGVRPTHREIKGTGEETIR